MANITVSTSLSNVNVNTTSNVVTVTSTPSNVVVTSLTTANIAAVRASLSAVNISGYGNITYDSSNTSNGVFQYVGVSNSDIITIIDDNPANIRPAISVTDAGGDGSLSYSNTTGVITYTGPSAAEVRAHISNTSPIEYNASTGVISIDSNAVFSGKTTDDLAEGTTNLYFTSDRANSNVEAHFASGVSSNIQTSANLIGAGGTFTSNVTIGGNLNVTGNINSSNVVDLFVEDRNITLQFGQTGSPTANSQIFVDRGTSANSYILWDEFADAWKFSNDGSTDYPIPTDTDDLSEGSTNLYFTNARANAAFVDSLDNITTDIVSNSDITTSGNITALNAGGADTHLRSNVVTGIPASEGGGDKLKLTSGGSQDEFILLDQPNNKIELDTSGNIDYKAREHLYEGNLTVGPYPGDTGGGLHLSSNTATITQDGSDGVRFDDGITILGNNKNLGMDNGNILVYNGAISVSQSNSTGRGFIVAPNITLSGSGGSGSGSAVYVSGSNAQIQVSGENGNVTAAHFHVVPSGNYQPYAFEASTISNESNNTGKDLILMTGLRNDVLTGTSGGNIWLTTRGFANAEVKIRNDGITFKPELVMQDGANVQGILTSNSNITTTANVAGNYFVGNVDATTVTATGNIDTTANINAAGGTLTGVLTSNSNLEITDTDAFFIGDINGAVQQEVRNETGATLNKGKAVYLTGAATGDTPHVALADNSNASLMPALGIVKNNIANASVGEVVTSGELNIGTHGFTLGDDLFINGTGDLSTTKPTGESELIQKIGKVVSTTHIIVQGAFRSNETPNLNEGNIFLGSSSNTAITVTPDTNFVTAGNVFELSNTLTDVNSITSETASGITLKGQTGGIDLDKTVNSGDTTILDIDTDGYRLFSADAGNANIASYTGGVKGMLILGSATAGSPTINTLPLSFIGYPAGHQVAGQSGATAYLDLTGASQTIEAAFANASAFGGVQNGEGWKMFVTSGTFAGFTGAFDRDTHVSSISGNTITLNKNATATTGYAGMILIPAIASSTEPGFDSLIDYTVGSYNFEGFTPFTQKYYFPNTVSNVTIDRTSVSDDFDLANVVYGHVADLEVGQEDYVRIPRGILIGSNATADPFSIRETSSLTSGAGMMGVTLEHDGDTSREANNTPQVKFLINNYKANSVASLASVPKWASDFTSGNTTVDNQYLGAPTFNFKTLNEFKANTTAGATKIDANTVIGQIAWNTVSGTSALDTVGTEVGLNTGSDLIHPPAGIKVRVASDQTTSSNVAALDMYLQSTYRTSYRDGTSTAKGGIPRTFLANKEGNTIIAAKTDGRIALKPVRDYGDSGNAATFTENRFPHELHDYHTFLSASFANTSARTGTLIQIQPDAGETGGSTDFNYDSKGNATLRFNTQYANSIVRGFWDIRFDESTQELIIEKDGTEEVKMDVDKTTFTNIPVMPSHSNTALPSSVAGGMIYVTNGNNKPAYGDGTNWYYYDNTQVT